MSELYKKLVPHIDKAMALQTALTILNWDSETLAPEQSITNTSRFIGILSGELYHASINDEVKELLTELSKENEFLALDDIQKKIVTNLKKEFLELEKIPANEFQAYSELNAKSMSIWAKAKGENNFSSFRDTLEELVAYKKKFSNYCKKEDQSQYDYLLDSFEEGITTKELDEFFKKIRSAIVPLLQEVVKKNGSIDKSYNSRTFDLIRQKEFCNYLAEYIGFDFSRGVIGESEHPFTTHLHNKDVRFTTHYHENNLESSMFSVIHEGGHALYEMNVADELALTPLGSGTSMGVHESQSRFFENIIGRSKSFWTPLWPKLKETFKEELEDVTLDLFIKGINKAEPDFIRTEADELTYSLHIMVRYEIEKMLFSDEITVDDLPKVWSEKYQEYLGITPKTDALGVLQDVHWAGGMFGYFPSYALGSAIAAQIYYYIKEQMPFDEYLLAGNLEPIREFLKNHIHKYGSLKNTKELLIAMTGESLNADYYVRYLTEKYQALYEL